MVTYFINMLFGNMEKNLTPRFGVSDFIAITNQSLEIAFGAVEIEGEVASFKVNRDQYIFFDLKDATGLVSCFMMKWQLRVVLEEGMRVVVGAVPKLTDRGKFSLTVKWVQPVGDGSLKKNYDLLKAKLDAEGLFDNERKRQLPDLPTKIAIISSVEAAGYADFMKIASSRMGGIDFEVANVRVQGVQAADQIINAINYFNQRINPAEVIVIIRGGGSRDDLAVFDDELLVRAVAASRIPTLTGIGHEIDESLSDLAADKSAVTPSEAAQMLIPDSGQIVEDVKFMIDRMSEQIESTILDLEDEIVELRSRMTDQFDSRLESTSLQLDNLTRMLEVVDPRAVLSRGYALIRGEVGKGRIIEVETSKQLIKAKVEEVHEK